MRSGRVKTPRSVDDGECDMDDCDITNELIEIGRLIDSARLIEVVRSSVRSVLKGQRSMVVGGKFAEDRAEGSSNYDVVVVHDGTGEVMELVARRIRDNVRDVEVDRLVDSVIGVRTARKEATDEEEGSGS